MDYQTGNIGRVLTIRFDHEEDVLSGLRQIALHEQIRSAWFQILGGIRQARVVTGPREPVMPPDPVWLDMDDVREVVGTGSLYMDGGEPRIHLHAAMGHHGHTLTACLRRDVMTYLVLEVLLFEIQGMELSRPWDEERGFYRLCFDAGNA